MQYSARPGKYSVKITTILVFVLGLIAYPLTEYYFNTKAQASVQLDPLIDQQEESLN